LKEEDGGKKWYKARLLVNGFAQKKGIYFDEIFYLVVKMTSIRTILSLVEIQYFHIEHLYVKTTFLSYALNNHCQHTNHFFFFGLGTFFNI
jgi:hypothetical protein